MLTTASVLTSLPLARAGDTAIAAAAAANTIASTAPPVQASTQLTLGSYAVSTATYAQPSLQDSPFQMPRAWASPPDDAISQRMQRNQNTRTSGLDDQWRGLGGALLARFTTTQSSYFQTVADYATGASSALGRSTETSNVQALNLVQRSGTQVSLSVQTHTGRTVEIKIALGNASSGAQGLHVEMHASGPLTTSERKALAQMAEGFDAVLEGLGQAGAPALALSGLLQYDKSVLSQVDLVVKNSHRSTAGLQSFRLHSSPAQHTVALDSSTGTLALEIDLHSPPGAVDARQKHDSIQQYLAQFDAATARSHGNAQLLAQFKAAFVALHTTPPAEQLPGGVARATTTASAASITTTALSDAMQAQVLPLLSGLKDFQASFGGDFEHNGPQGGITEAGQSLYQMAQKTSLQPGSDPGAMRVRQTLTTQLEARYQQSRGGVLLDLKKGNYDEFRIQDSSEATTAIDVANHSVSSAVRHTLVKQFVGFERFENHRSVDKSGTPTAQARVEQLR